MKRLVLLLWLCVTCLQSLVAQDVDRAKSLVVGISPLSHIATSVFHSGSDENYNYAYKNGWSVNLGYERQVWGVVTLSELAYTHATFDHYILKGMSKYFDPAQQADINAITFTQYAGWTFNKLKRLQFPVYVGLGGDYIKGGVFSNLTLHGAVKARVKFYVTEHIAVFGGARAYYGFGSKSRSDGSQDVYTLHNSGSSLDLGVIIGI